jgi:autotransporter-associated beta strand protein
MGTSSLVIAGTGSQTLSGTNTFTGTTTVQSGTLILNGSLTGELDVTVAGTLKGTGTAGNVVLTDGTIAPGQSIGTIHFSTYTSTGGVYQTEVNGQSQSDLIDVSGTAILSGGTVLVSSPDGTYTFQRPYTIVTAGTRGGTYASATSVSPMVQSYLTYDSQHVYLTLLSNTAAAAKTHNERNVANQLDEIIDPNPLQSQLLSEIVSLPSLDDGTQALDSLSGWQYTSDLWVAQTVNGEFVKRLYDGIRPIVTNRPKILRMSK